MSAITPRRWRTEAHPISQSLYAALVAAERAASAALDASYEEYTSLWLRMALGRAQSILMHQVVKYAASASPSESEQT